MSKSHKIPCLAQPTFQPLKFRNQQITNTKCLISQAIETVSQYQKTNSLRAYSTAQSKRDSEVSSLNGTCNNIYENRKLENTYVTDPNTRQKFKPFSIEAIVKEILNERLENVNNYDANKCKDLVQTVSEEIKMKIKPLVYNRYKIIVSMMISQNLGQSLTLVSRSLWNTDIDNSCTVQFKNRYLYSVVMIFAVYHE